MFRRNKQKKGLLWIVAIIVIGFLFYWLDKYSKSWYLPEAIRNVTLIDSFDVGDICGAKIFQLDKNTSETILKSGTAYLNDKTITKIKANNPYSNWRKTPVVGEGPRALGGFTCNGNFDNDRLTLIRDEIEYDRGYYTVAENDEYAIFVLPKLSLVAFVYYDR
jgi:hypothetical protein